MLSSRPVDRAARLRGQERNGEYLETSLASESVLKWPLRWTSVRRCTHFLIAGPDLAWLSSSAQLFNFTDNLPGCGSSKNLQMASRFQQVWIFFLGKVRKKLQYNLCIMVRWQTALSMAAQSPSALSASPLQPCTHAPSSPPAVPGGAEFVLHRGCRVAQRCSKRAPPTPLLGQGFPESHELCRDCTQ